jgi:hypothetical protein
MDEATSSALIEKLIQGVKRARVFFDPNTSDAGRLSAFVALTSVIEFLSSVDPDPAMLVPLRQLHYALADLDRGKVVPLLSPTKISGRPPDSLSHDAFRAAVASAMDVMVAAKINKKEAASEVAKELSSLGYRDLTGGRITATMVEGWRERMMTELPAMVPAVDRFRRFRKIFQAHPPNDSRARAMAMLRELTLVAPLGNPKNLPS